ncbi:hypothetical protein GCM10007209_16200 [Haloferax sulfurifontis]|uniref:Uncharacterized protein n=1 Tax=Haloferax sulfurifontis TaxID=255616 RepID=A0A830DVZ8_9EURY|nr:hypothetical protein GCM10007209_16200 [Haloferax sulfurifontis]
MVDDIRVRERGDGAVGIKHVGEAALDAFGEEVGFVAGHRGHVLPAFSELFYHRESDGTGPHHHVLCHVLPYARRRQSGV